jgi:hypothetical protein
MMNVRGLSKAAVAVAAMTMLPVSASAAQVVRASESLPSSTLPVAEDARAGAALNNPSAQDGIPEWLMILLVLLAVGAGIAAAVSGGDEGPRSPA